MSFVKIPSGHAWPRGPETSQSIEDRLPPQYRLNPGTDSDVVMKPHPHGDAPKRPRVRYMPSLEAPLLSQVATMSGFLKKQADNEPGKWTKYYFVLKPTTYLYYYNTEHDTDPRGIIDTEFLRDVRFNADCVQRGVGASTHGFRLTGQLPPAFRHDANGTHASQLRPVYLDADSRDVADAWMDAIRHHRFNVERYKDYDELLATMDKVDERMTSLTEELHSLTTASQRIVTKGKEYLLKLRGEETQENEGGEGLLISESEQGSTEALLWSVSVLFDNMFAEGDRHYRAAELLRARDGEHFQRETQLKACQAELEELTTRYEQLDRDLERHVSEQKAQEQVYEQRCAAIDTREHLVAKREADLETLTKQREREYEQKLQEVERRAAELTKELKKETTRANGEIEKQQKALAKQQRALEQKQKQLDRQVKPSSVRSVGIAKAVRNKFALSRSSSTSDDDTLRLSDKEGSGEMATTQSAGALAGSFPNETTIGEDKGRMVEREVNRGDPHDASPEHQVLPPPESLEQKKELSEQEKSVEPSSVQTETLTLSDTEDDSNARKVTLDVEALMGSQQTKKKRDEDQARINQGGNVSSGEDFVAQDDATSGDHASQDERELQMATSTHSPEKDLKLCEQEPGNMPTQELQTNEQALVGEEERFALGDTSTSELPTLSLSISDTSTSELPTLSSSISDTEEISIETPQPSGDLVPSILATTLETTTATPSVLPGLPVESSLLERLPPEWTCKESTSYHGRLYYFNVVTGETRWDFPLDVLLPDQASSESSEHTDPDTSGTVTEPASRDDAWASHTPNVEDDNHSILSQVETLDVSTAASVDPNSNSTPKPKTLWRNMLLAKVQLSKGQTQTPTNSSTRSLLDGTRTSNAHRYEF